MELVRLAFPRRTCTQSHFGCAAEAICGLKARAHEVRGVTMVKQAKVSAPLHRRIQERVKWRRLNSIRTGPTLAEM